MGYGQVPGQCVGFMDCVKKLDDGVGLVGCEQKLGECVGPIQCEAL